MSGRARRRHHCLVVVLGGLAGLGLATGGCSDRSDVVDRSDSPTSEGDRLVVLTVNEPLRALAARIGGDLVDARYPGPADEDPAFWVPDDAAVRAYQAAGLVLRNGADYAKWTAQVSLPFARTVDTSASFADRLIQFESAVTHSHGPEGEHAHGGTAFTTWLDHSLAVEQARAIEAALVRRLPGEATEIAARADLVVQELETIGAKLLEVDASHRGAPMIASHPVYQYLARRYGLDVRAVHFEPGVVPDADGWAALDALLAERPASIMLWEGAPLAETVRGLDERGLRVVVFDPCGAPPADGDFFAIQRRNVEALVDALR